MRESGDARISATVALAASYACMVSVIIYNVGHSPRKDFFLMSKVNLTSKWQKIYKINIMVHQTWQSIKE